MVTNGLAFMPTLALAAKLQYFNAMHNPENPFHNAVGGKKRVVKWQEASHGWARLTSQSSMYVFSLKASILNTGKRLNECKSGHENQLPENLEKSIERATRHGDLHGRLSDKGS